MVGWCGEAGAEQRPLCRNFSNHAAERYGSTLGARSPGVNPWLVARSASNHGRRLIRQPSFPGGDLFTRQPLLAAEMPSGRTLLKCVKSLKSNFDP